MADDTKNVEVPAKFKELVDSISAMSVLDLSALYYLDTENEWVRKQLFRVPSLDGMAIIIDWETRTITSVKYAD